MNQSVIPLLSINPKEMSAYVHKWVCRKENVHKGHFYSSPKVETIQMSINWRRDQQGYILTLAQLAIKNTKKDTFQRHYVAPKKQDPEEYTQ